MTQWGVYDNPLKCENFITFNFPPIHRYEAKRLEIEAWITRMESRAERMGVVATTADILDAQQKEQKVISSIL